MLFINFRDTSLRLQGRTGRQAVVQKMSELQKSIDGWEGRDIWQSCSEFILGKTYRRALMAGRVEIYGRAVVNLS